MRVSILACAARGAATALLVSSMSCGQGSDEPQRLEERAAWGGRPAPEAIDGVRVGRVDRGIQLMNGTDEQVFYAVWALHYLGQFTPCTEAGSDCLELDRGARVVVPFDAIVGSAPDERDAVVRWWRVERESTGGRRPRDLHVIGVPLGD